MHKNAPYEFVDRGPSDWMSRHFFSGGIMPSDDLPLYFQQKLTIAKRWHWNGQHYEKTLNGWLARMDQHNFWIPPGKRMVGEPLSVRKTSRPI